MSTYRILILMDNDAFQDGNEGAEVARILRKLADHAEADGSAEYVRLFDANGNHVGDASSAY